MPRLAPGGAERENPCRGGGGDARFTPGSHVGYHGEQMSEFETRAAARAARMTLRKGHLGEPEVDLSPVAGAEAVSLVHRLTRSSYSLSGKTAPAYDRANIPFKFVPWPRS